LFLCRFENVNVVEEPSFSSVVNDMHRKLRAHFDKGGHERACVSPPQAQPNVLFTAHNPSGITFNKSRTSAVWPPKTTQHDADGCDLVALFSIPTTVTGTLSDASDITRASEHALINSARHSNHISAIPEAPRSDVAHVQQFWMLTSTINQWLTVGFCTSDVDQSGDTWVGLQHGKAFVQRAFGQVRDFELCLRLRLHLRFESLGSHGHR
jgi:hypothetical protein